MKKNRTGTKKFPALILFLFGFLAGNLIPNIIWKAKWQQKTWASVYFLSTFAGKNTGNIEYLKEILKYRGVFYLLNIICGFSVFGAPLAVIMLLGSGLYAGMIMTVSILEFGFAGGVIGMGLLLPQYLFYIPDRKSTRLALFYGTGMEDIIRNMEKQRSDFRRSQYLS